MQDNWLQWSEKFSVMPQREKLMIFLVGLFLLGYLCIWFVISPLQAGYSNNQQRIENLKRQQENSITQLDMLKEALNRDYTQELVAQEETLKANIDEINKQLAEFSLSYISPDDMASVLQQLLRRHKEIKLSKFKINPVVPIYAKHPNEKVSESQAANLEVAFYQHTMMLQLEGGYFSLLSYLKQIKQIDEKLFIQSFDYQVDKYPTGKLTLTIATVSANDKFIAL